MKSYKPYQNKKYARSVSLHDKMKDKEIIDFLLLEHWKTLRTGMEDIISCGDNEYWQSVVFHALKRSLYGEKHVLDIGVVLLVENVLRTEGDYLSLSIDAVSKTVTCYSDYPTSLEHLAAETMIFLRDNRLIRELDRSTMVSPCIKDLRIPNGYGEYHGFIVPEENEVCDLSEFMQNPRKYKSLSCKGLQGWQGWKECVLVGMTKNKKTLRLRITLQDSRNVFIDLSTNTPEVKVIYAEQYRYTLDKEDVVIKAHQLLRQNNLLTKNPKDHPMPALSFGSRKIIIETQGEVRITLSHLVCPKYSKLSDIKWKTTKYWADFGVYILEHTRMTAQIILDNNSRIFVTLRLKPNPHIIITYDESAVVVKEDGSRGLISPEAISEDMKRWINENKCVEIMQESEVSAQSDASDSEFLTPVKENVSFPMQQTEDRGDEKDLPKNGEMTGATANITSPIAQQEKAALGEGIESKDLSDRELPNVTSNITSPIAQQEKTALGKGIESKDLSECVRSPN